MFAGVSHFLVKFPKLVQNLIQNPRRFQDFMQTVSKFRDIIKKFVDIIWDLENSLG